MSHRIIRQAVAQFIADVDLSPEECRQLQAFGRREALVDALLSEDPRANQVFMRIERVFPSEPVNLAGEEVPSLAHNRMILELGADDPATGDRVPGRTLLSCLLSEKALASLMMRTNRGDTDVSMTAESVLGSAVPRSPRAADTFIADAFQENLERVAEKPALRVRNLRRAVREAKIPFPKKVTERLDRSLRTDPLGRGDFAFTLERHVENIQK